jgi:hypothetical protein
MTFAPATSKLEALIRIARGTGRPLRPLGPGSKEKKAALEDVAFALDLAVDFSRPKPALGSAITKALGQPWGAECHSTGNTITLVGLNRILEGAERHPRWLRQLAPVAGLEAEADGIAAALGDVIESHWDGKACVSEMHSAGEANWAQMEWAGFYFEFVGVTRCIARLGGGRVRYGRTDFDYALGGVWDFKVHGASSTSLILNDVEAVDLVLADDRSMGFVVLSVDVEKDDDGEFQDWHDRLKRAHGKDPKPPKVTPKGHRGRKTSVAPTALDIFAFATPSAVESAIADGVVGFYKQGRQASGALRKPKYELSLRAANGSKYRLHHRDL